MRQTSTSPAADLTAEHIAAAEFAAAAGELLLELREASTTEDRGDLGDHRAHELLMQLIGERELESGPGSW
ncbi:hypothetical protein BH10ACT3_BH10ACT3_09720 [soil metagenome]